MVENSAKCSASSHQEIKLPCFCWLRAPTHSNFTEPNKEGKKETLNSVLPEPDSEWESLFWTIKGALRDQLPEPSIEVRRSELQTPLIISATPVGDSTSSEKTDSLDTSCMCQSRSAHQYLHPTSRLKLSSTRSQLPLGLWAESGDPQRPWDALSTRTRGSHPRPPRFATCERWDMVARTLHLHFTL